MTKASSEDLKEGLPTSLDYEKDPEWRRKPLTPAQLLVHDIGWEAIRPERGPLLELRERAASGLVPDAAARSSAAVSKRIFDATDNPIDRQRLSSLEDGYGWMRHLRLRGSSSAANDTADPTKCRWIHGSFKHPEYLKGFLWALSDDVSSVADSLRVLDKVIERHTRFSKHGKCFAPFAQTLRGQPKSATQEPYPLLISIPFLDWTVSGGTPPLRFQIDRKEGFRSTRSPAHIVRSILQYYYRLEDTADRESSQVFSKHKPWSTNRDLDLKVRQWYGHYPTSLNVDELWVLVVDAQHIVTLSSNQTWKARWPPLQLSSRITDVAFRSLRNTFSNTNQSDGYSALTHAVVCLSGAVGLLHRNFWPDVVLPLADRYAGHLGHLQYRLHRSPSTKLVMDLMACQEELNIVIQITEQQLDMIRDLQSTLETPHRPRHTDRNPPADEYTASPTYRDSDDAEIASPTARHITYRHHVSTSNLPDPVAQLMENLDRELTDLKELRDNTDRLVNRTIQLVNIRLEDHGKAILVFTVVTIIFLPLNFVSSFFGMNVKDIRNLAQSQWIFWATALSVTVGVLSLSIFLAFSGGSILEQFRMWRDARRERDLSWTSVSKSNDVPTTVGFRVLNDSRIHDV